MKYCRIVSLSVLKRKAEYEILLNKDFEIGFALRKFNRTKNVKNKTNKGKTEVSTIIITCDPLKP